MIRSHSIASNGRMLSKVDYDFQTDIVIEHRRPDIVVLKTNENECQITDVAKPAGYNITAKLIEKIINYSNPKFEISSL